MTARARAQFARAHRRRCIVAVCNLLRRTSLHDALVRTGLRDDLIAYARNLGYAGAFPPPPPPPPRRRVSPHSPRREVFRMARKAAATRAPRGWQSLDANCQRAVQVIIDALRTTHRPGGRVLTMRRRKQWNQTTRARAS